ncbi:MAG: peptide ABC transporter substrate-binding protein [Salinarimonadaceae bacterium]|nr:MAG: peptide ABC transporter substrate-binding protein [Salinarimonadaceae bacterium]
MLRSATILQARLPLGDPHDCSDDPDEIALLRAVYDTLVVRSSDGFTPRLAQNWSASREARLWRIRLRPGLIFHDGSPCDAPAVQHSLLRMARPDRGVALGASGVWAPYLAGAEIVAEDALTLRVGLNEPMADFLDLLAQAYIAAPSSFAALDAGRTRAPIGAGPFRIVRVTASEILARRFDAQVSGPAPAHYEIIWRAEPDPALRLAALMERRAQVATGLDFATSRALDAAGGTRVETLSPVCVVVMMEAARGPLSDPRLRRALDLAIDREAIARTATGCAAAPLAGFVSPRHLGAVEGSAPNRDLARARALVEEAGHGDGLRLTLDYPTSMPDEAPAIAALVADQAAPVGFSIDIRKHEDRAAYARLVSSGEAGDLCVFDSTPLSTFRTLREKLDSRAPGPWWRGYRNPAVEAAIDEGRREPEDARRGAAYARAFRALQDDPAWLCLYNPLRVAGLAGRHRDFRFPPDGAIDAAALPPLAGV